ncbi:fha domain protein [Colletotrichum truncatum]|uniref:Fha domain protein n=1 Tax=Colletotrichum truncatum TaxID=5467 RepID=A0ACC3Z670_COLTU|nr:fha domain protein [Colletotrichum truncatum]KAF6787234.1 fha domain protein [Colletotrichum truncatum]
MPRPVRNELGASGNLFPISAIWCCDQAKTLQRGIEPCGINQYNIGAFETDLKLQLKQFASGVRHEKPINLNRTKLPPLTQATENVAMGSDDEHRSHKPRRSRYDDDDDERLRRDTKDMESHRRRRSGDRDGGRDSDRRRERRRSRSRDRHERRRSRTPESSARRRSRSRDRDRERRRRRSPHNDDRGRSSGKELSRRRHHDHPDPESGTESSNKRRTASPLRRLGPLPSQGDSFAVSKGEEPEKPKEKPNLRNSGALAAASNSVQQADGTSIVLKYHEPAEARKPPAKDQWKLFVFKGADIVDTIDLGLRSCWLIGREAAVVDLMAEHPSISKQHAVIQFRHVEKRNEFGDRIGKVKPYLIDLESANGTILNGDKVADSRYYELRDKDMIKLGHSTREYVLMLAPKD